MKTLLVLFFLIVGSVDAENMSIETHSALITKLESVLNFSEESVSKQNMKIRLADLYSERARMYAMQESGQGDVKFKKEILSDRQRAIHLYSEAFESEADARKKGLLLFQMAHLHLLTANPQKAMTLYKNIIEKNKNQDPLLLADSHVELGDLYFNQGEFKKAKNHFENALKIPGITRATYSRYRISWCEFHDGKTESAIGSLKKLLQDKGAFQKSNGETDMSFREEASRDLATFLARRELKDHEISLLINLSPENARQANLTYLATELDRTGKKNSALKVWAILGSQNKDSDSRLEGQIKIAKIQYDLGKKQQTVQELKTAIRMLKEVNCKDQCITFQHQIRKIITDWGVAEEKSPSLELVAAYNAYDFDDAEMALWGAGSAHKRKQWKDAFMLYSKAARISDRKIKSFDQKSLDKNIYKIFEAALLGAIDVAERSEDVSLKQSAYQQYLDLNPKGIKSLEVEYQIAQLTLEQKKYSQAADLFKAVAYSNKSDSQGLKEKAADLSLDTLALLKDDKKIESWANEYSKKFPSKKQEYDTISRKAVLNLAALTINTSKSESSLTDQYEKLSEVDLSKASADEIKKFHQHKLLIAAKTQNLDAMIVSGAALLKSKKLSQEEKNDTFTQLSWAHEMKFEFQKSYEYLKKVEVNKNQQAEHELKLAILAELAGKKTTEHYESFLKHSKDKQKNAAVALSLVRMSKNKEATFLKYKSTLKHNESAFAQAGLFAYEESKSQNVEKTLLATPGFSKTFEGQLLLRQKALKNIEGFSKEIQQHKISIQTQSSMAQTMKRRMALLDKLEAKVQGVVRTKDFSSQMIALKILATENKRFANDIGKLPIPKGLNKNQKEEYLKLVAQQVKPYLNQEEEIQSKLSSLWRNRDETSFEDVFLVSTQPVSPGYRLAQNEVSLVLAGAKKLGFSIADYEADKIRQNRQKLSQDLVDLKKKTQKNPFDSSYLKQMKKIEESLNPGPMVAYLNMRIQRSE